MQSWKMVLRDGFIPQWDDATLERAVVALEADIPFLTQGSTTTPPPLMCVQDWKLEACDLIAYCSVADPTDCTVGEAEEGFARSCFDADQRLGEPAACRWFLNWYDDGVRQEVFALIADEFRLALRMRKISREQAVGKLPAELQTALKTFPTDRTLKGACIDHLLEQGLEAEAEILRK
jgi:hypothetical protein